MGWNQQILNLKHRFENRRPSLSRLVLGTKIKNPVERFGESFYELAAGIPIQRTDAVTSTESTKVEEGAAFDCIVVEASDGSLHHAGDSGEEFCSFSVAFAKWNSLRLGQSRSFDDDNGNDDDDNEVHDPPPPESITMAMKIQNMDESGDTWLRVHKAEEPIERIQGDMTPWPWEELCPLLREGANHVVFFCLRQQGDETPLLYFARASIWLWKVCDKVVISDIDGTLTKSNARGVLGTIITQNYDMVTHSGVCDLLSRLANSNATLYTKSLSESSPPLSLPKTRVVYLTSRPIHLANKTREFLSGLVQTAEGSVTGLPKGPLLGFGGNLAKVLSMEVLSKTTQAFKAGELETHIVGPFQRARECKCEFQKGEITNETSKDCGIFVAAFGNNLNDVQAYHKIGMDLNKIFLIDKNSTIVTFDKEVIDDNGPPRGEEGFPPHSWYKDRISTIFDDGYFDKKLRTFLRVIDE